MNSERLRMIENRSHVGENLAMLVLFAAGIIWPLILLAQGG